MLTDINIIRRFIEAGNATLTVKSAKSGKHFTYSFRNGDKGFFVSVKHGHEDSYMGVIHEGNFRLTRASRVSQDAPSAVALQFFLRCVYVFGALHRDLEVRHEGKCGRCGRPLTHPTSIDIGIGPDCLEKM